jgi:hypothetical protein
MELQEGICRRCQRDDAKRTTNEEGQQELRLFSDEDFADPGEMPKYLPSLAQFKEMLIVRVHTFMEVRQHRGQQFNTGGHLQLYDQRSESLFKASSSSTGS